MFAKTHPVWGQSDQSWWKFYKDAKPGMDGFYSTRNQHAILQTKTQTNKTIKQNWHQTVTTFTYNYINVYTIW